MEHFSCDVLVIGSGAAGIRAGISAREKGLDVCVISKGAPGKGTSTILSGGIFAGARQGGDPEVHRQRTLLSGRGINQRELVDAIVNESPSRLKELLDWGIEATAYQGDLIAQGRPPIWGEEIVRCLLTKARASGVKFVSGLVVRSIFLKEGFAGILGYSTERGRWFTIVSRALVLATGGAGGLYLHSDNPRSIMGDGYALALQAGAVLQDMEFVQFYPLCFSEKGFPRTVIFAQLAELGRLFNSREEDLKAKYGIEGPDAGMRARDRLSQAIFKEIHKEGRAVWIDLRNVPEDKWRTDPYFSSSREFLRERCGAKHHPLRVAPLAHHVMGGVRIDRSGATTVPGLFAAGEVTGGLHGANRLGGNGLTETLVFGARAGASAASWALDSGAGRWNETLVDDLQAFLPEPRIGSTSSSTAELKQRLQKILWEDGGIIRNKEGLTRSLKMVEEICSEAQMLSSGESPRETQRVLELNHGVVTASLILRAALMREESRGAHFREDFPEQDDNCWQGHIQVHLAPEGLQVWSFEPMRTDSGNSGCET